MTVSNKFKNSVLKVVRRAATIPYVRRAVRIASGIWRIPETRRQLDELSDKLVALAGKVSEHENLVQSVPVTLRNLTQGINTLDNRIEFVRRELMFEMRYGASSKQLGEVERDARPKIIAEAKLQAARNSVLRLNLGCGHIPLDDYINIDRRELSNVDVIADVSALPFEKGEVDEIFSAHVLEHFPQEQLRREQLLPYWKSLLKPGGIFRAVVPDAEFMVREYCEDNYPFAHLREVTFGSQDYDGDFHFNMFSRDQLSELLTMTGFSNVQFEATGRRNGICFEMAVAAKNGTQ